MAHLSDLPDLLNDTSYDNEERKSAIHNFFSFEEVLNIFIVNMMSDKLDQSVQQNYQ